MRCILRVVRNIKTVPELVVLLRCWFVQNRNSLPVVPAKLDRVSSSHQCLSDGVCFSPRVWIVITLRGIDRRWRTEAKNSKAWIKEN